MITVRLKIVDYDKHKNTYKAKLLNGDIIAFDPFVSCAIAMTDEEYKNNKGFKYVGNNYILTEYTVYNDIVIPSEGGIIAV